MAKAGSSSRAWLRERRGDSHALRARREGYRSRACYKLLELHAGERLFRPGMTVFDLGAAPGGWSQVAARLVAPGGRVVACDLLPMGALPGVEFVRGDFSRDSVRCALRESLGGARADLVISDMAPNMSGIGAVDQPRAMRLAELALDFARRVLRPGGALVAKLFQGEGCDSLRRDCRGGFARVALRKPAASRPRSSEVYLVARGYRG